MKTTLGICAALFITFFATIALALPDSQSTRSLLPFVTDQFYLGTSTPSTLEWNGIFTKNLTVSGTCTGCGGGGSGAWPFTASTWAGVANQSTTTPLYLPTTMIIASTTFFTNASSTNFTHSGTTWFSGLTANTMLGLDVNNKVYSAATGTITGAGGIAVGTGSFVVGSNLTLTGAATSTFTSPLIYTNSTNAVTLQAASASQAGSMAAGDFNRLYAATTTFSSPLSYSNSTNAVTCATCLTGNQTITLSGDVTGSGATAITTTIAPTVTHWWTALQNFTNATTSGFEATSTNIFFSGLTANTMLALNGNKAAYTVATGTITGAGGIAVGTGSFIVGSNLTITGAATSTFTSPLIYTNSTNAVTLQAASASQTGSMASADYNRLYAATTTFSSPLTYTNSTNAVTCATCITQGATSTNPFMATYFVATSTTATSTFAGPVSINADYLHVGTSTNTVNPCTTQAQTCFELIGNDNTALGVSNIIQNANSSINAYSDFFLQNDEPAALANYGALALNSTQYTSTTFGTAFAIPNQLSLVNTFGPLTLGATAASSTYINFITGGNATANERMRINNWGAITMGTTTTQLGGLTIGTSTVPQLLLSDNTAADNLWGFRVAGNSFFFSTSTANATSTGPSILAIGPNGTSTHANGINVLTGCVSVNGTCIGAAGPAGAATTTLFVDNNTFSGLNAFSNFTLMGTTTPGNGTLTLASSTGPQLSLSDKTAADSLWTFRNAGGNLYIASSTANATSTNAAFTLFGNQWPAFSIGTTTAWAQFSLSANTGGSPYNDIFAIASSTATATTTLFAIGNSGHVFASSTNPVLSSCGTAPTMVGDDTHGVVTEGTVSTGCTLTFQVPYSLAPACSVSDESATSSFAYSLTGTAITVTDSNIGNTKWTYVCEGFTGPQ